MNLFGITIFYIFITSIHANVALIYESASTTILTNTIEFNIIIDRKVVSVESETISDTTTINIDTTKTDDNDSSSDVTDTTPSSSSLRTLLKAEPPPTRSAQIGMSLGITFFGIILIGEIIYFKYFYHGQRNDIM
ncbi:unnamed protein product [Rotaria sordida]|uniref:Uncharacterized protein n=1 Tax=Rotaria sordida TaxID=392033 RepID=A0A813Q6V3_9BILA|nr:unnamed protein product [Rotaria sordida]CAF0768000.1 unnamed protein product [Rotaria sordida]CAF0853936.1 unnamed protein product [Rotaria sordida]CAF3639894.1 unnamed protein product [Rotaria sordida]CAF3653511.1 unnamed protein product [Rotaria sordida]